MTTPVCKKIWNIRHPIQCRLIGVLFDEQEAERVAQKFGLTVKEGVSRSFMAHQAILNKLDTRNAVSISLQKTAKKRLDKYRKLLNDRSWHELLEEIRQGDFSEIPLAGYMWAAVNVGDAPEDAEDQLFGIVHMLEHEALRNRPAEGGGSSDVEDIMTRLESLNARIEVETEKNRSLQKALSEETQERKRLKNELRIMGERLKNTEADDGDAGRPGDLQEEVERLKRENRILTEEIESLHGQCGDENSSGAPACITGRDPGRVGEGESGARRQCPRLNGEAHCFSGKKIAMVGGLDALAPHIKKYIEESGGEFLHHKGLCSGGAQNLDNMVSKVDVVLCPVDVNSHFACIQVKRRCKARRKPCVFLQSSGLSSVKKSLRVFAKAKWKEGSSGSPSH